MGNRESSSTFESRTTSDHPDRHKAEAGHKHIVLLGDSTFDNKAYTRGGPCVVEQLTLILEQEMAREREQAKRKKEAAATAIDPAAFEPPSEKQQQAHEQEGEGEQEQEQEQERQKVDSKQDEDVESKEEESKEEEEIEEESKATAKDKGKTMKATLLAEDGAVLAGLASQLDQVPADATHLILSIGGNDLLAKTSILSQRCDSVQHGLSKLQLVMSDLEQRYETGIRTVLERFPRQRLLLCSVYTGCYRPFGNTKYQQEAINVAVAIFADIIVRVAHRLALPVLDFRRFMTEPGDFANPIEPSSQGAAKIAAHIFHIVQSHTWDPALPLVYPLQFPAAADPLRAFSSA